jgi:sugar lactone lactonase YvrE
MRVAVFLTILTAVVFGQTTITIAGTGTAGFSGDGGPGITAQINNPYGLAIGPDAALYFCEIGNHRVRRLDLKSGLISTAAGSGRKGYAGDGGPALDADLNEPYEVTFDTRGNMFFVEMQNHVVRRVDAKSGIISTIAGTGMPGFSGDGGAASAAQLRQPHSIVLDRQGRLLICDIGNHRIRRVDLGSGKIETWAGTGERKPTPDGAPIAGTPLNGPRALAVAPDGTLYLALREGNAVLRIDSAAGRIFQVAEKLSGPKGIAWSPDQSLYLADTESHSIKRIDLKSGAITTVVSGLARPHGIFVSSAGTVYIGDSEAHRIRMLRVEGR